LSSPKTLFNFKKQTIVCLCLWPKLLPHPQLIFPSKTWFFGGNLFEFSVAEITLKSISPYILNPNLTK